MARNAVRRISFVDLPENVILKIQVAAGDPSAVYGVEAPKCCARTHARACGGLCQSVWVLCVFVRGRLCAKIRQFGVQDIW